MLKYLLFNLTALGCAYNYLKIIDTKSNRTKNEMHRAIV